MRSVITRFMKVLQREEPMVPPFHEDLRYWATMCVSISSF